MAGADCMHSYMNKSPYMREVLGRSKINIAYMGLGRWLLKVPYVYC